MPRSWLSDYFLQKEQVEECREWLENAIENGSASWRYGVGQWKVSHGCLTSHEPHCRVKSMLGGDGKFRVGLFIGREIVVGPVVFDNTGDEPNEVVALTCLLNALRESRGISVPPQAHRNYSIDA